MSYNNQYIITNISEVNNQYDKVNGIDQIPIIFSVNGAINIRKDVQFVAPIVCSNQLDFSEQCNSQYIAAI